jgi:hypothetical protein
MYPRVGYSHYFMAASGAPEPRQEVRHDVALGSPIPEVSVVVGAVQRGWFVHAAAESVLARTLPRDQFEILANYPP